MLALYMVLIAIGCYLIGSLNFSLIVSKRLHKSDIREFGSGNAGITNFYRTFGGRETFVVMAGDVLKCIIAALISGLILGTLGHNLEGRLWGGIYVMAGHMFPLYFGFRGGKGVLPACALIAVFDLRVFGICMAVFFVIVIITRYISLGSMLACAALPVTMYLFYRDSVWITLLSAAIPVLVIIMHRENIKRLFKGEESKFSFKSKK